MRKLRLDPDALEVKSFEPRSDRRANTRGTLFAREVAPPTTDCLTQIPPTQVNCPTLDCITPVPPTHYCDTLVC